MMTKIICEAAPDKRFAAVLHFKPVDQDAWRFDVNLETVDEALELISLIRKQLPGTDVKIDGCNRKSFTIVPYGFIPGHIASFGFLYDDGELHPIGLETRQEVEQLINILQMQLES